MVSIGLGSTESTFLNSNDRGETWTSVATPIQHGTPSAGIFSIDFVNSLEGFIVGGDYRGDNETTEANAARTTDGGITWNLIQDNRNPGTSNYEQKNDQVLCSISINLIAQFYFRAVSL